jgi:hypothetical protein
MMKRENLNGKLRAQVKKRKMPIMIMNRKGNK